MHSTSHAAAPPRPVPNHPHGTHGTFPHAPINPPGGQRTAHSGSPRRHESSPDRGRRAPGPPREGDRQNGTKPQHRRHRPRDSPRLRLVPRDAPRLGCPPRDSGSNIAGRWRTKTETRRALRQALSDVEAGRRAIPSRTQGQPVRRVRDAVMDYIDFRSQSPSAPISINTERGYRGDLRNHICNPRSTLGSTPLDKLTPVGVSQWLDDLALDGTGPGTISAARRLLNAALNYEVASGHLARNPAGLVRKPTSKAARAAGQKADVVILPLGGVRGTRPEPRLAGGPSPHRPTWLDRTPVV